MDHGQVGGPLRGVPGLGHGRGGRGSQGAHERGRIHDHGAADRAGRHRHGARRPDRASLDTFALHLETALDQAAAQHPNPGNTALHRLNRTEYGNAIRDLLGLDVDSAALLPADDSSEG